MDATSLIMLYYINKTPSWQLTWSRDSPCWLNEVSSRLWESPSDKELQAMSRNCRWLLGTLGSLQLLSTADSKKLGPLVLQLRDMNSANNLSKLRRVSFPSWASRWKQNWVDTDYTLVRPSPEHSAKLYLDYWSKKLWDSKLYCLPTFL